MSAQRVQAVLVTHLPDVRYLCGFTGSNAALAVTSKGATLFTDGRYTVQAKQETQGARVVIAPKSALGRAVAWLERSGAKAAYFDPENTTFAQLETIKGALKRRNGGFFRPLKEPLVSTLRLVKDADEMVRIEEAAALGCRLFEHLLPQIKSGIPEARFAAELEFAARVAGADSMAFETIVASGPRSALPHGRATAALLPRKGFVTLDFGVILNGYCSDMTRTVHLGRAGQRERFAYDAVLEAQKAAVDAVRPGVKCAEVDRAARAVLAKAGLGDYFTHSTGHGVGIEIHEAPRIAKRQKAKLEAGMVVTIEPGVYIEGEFGIRIEDMVAVTETGSKVLTPTAKTLIEV